MTENEIATKIIGVHRIANNLLKVHAENAKKMRRTQRKYIKNELKIKDWI